MQFHGRNAKTVAVLIAAAVLVKVKKIGWLVVGVVVRASE